MAEASGHDKEMKDLVRTEIFVAVIEDRKFQCVDDTSHRVDDASGQKPAESRSGEGVENRIEGKDAEPPHGNVDQGREPFGAVDPESFDQNSKIAAAQTAAQRRVPVLP